MDLDTLVARLKLIGFREEYPGLFKHKNYLYYVMIGFKDISYSNTIIPRDADLTKLYHEICNDYKRV